MITGVDGNRVYNYPVKYVCNNLFENMHRYMMTVLVTLSTYVPFSIYLAVQRPRTRSTLPSTTKKLGPPMRVIEQVGPLLRRTA